jgi:hypothetical protein
MLWERAKTPSGPWQQVPVQQVPKNVLRKAKRKKPGDLIPAYRYLYRYSEPAGESCG